MSRGDNRESMPSRSDRHGLSNDGCAAHTVSSLDDVFREPHTRRVQKIAEVLPLTRQAAPPLTEVSAIAQIVPADILEHAMQEHWRTQSQFDKHREFLIWRAFRSQLLLDAVIRR